MGHEKWAVLVAPSGIKGIYVKTRLVPFGEYIPFRQQLGWLTQVSHAASSNMTPGVGARVLTASDRAGRPLPIGVLVCFESAFPDMSRVDADNGAQLHRLPVRGRDVPGHVGTGPARVPRGHPRGGDRPPGRPGGADRGHGGVRRARSPARVAGPVGPRGGHRPPCGLPAGVGADVLRPGRRLRDVDRGGGVRDRPAGHDRRAEGQSPARFSSSYDWCRRWRCGRIWCRYRAARRWLA